MKPRIAVFLQDLSGGGAERMMLQLAEGIADRGHPVDLVLARAEGPYLEDVPETIRIVNLAAGRTFRSIPRLAAYLRRERPAAMLSGLVHVNIAALLAALLARSGTRVVISERNTISQDVTTANTFSIRLAHWLVPWLYPRADRIIAVSGGVADDLAQFARVPRAAIDVANNPVVTPRLKALAAEPVDHPWLAPGEPPVVLGVGRLSRQKDFATLIKAVARIQPKRPVRLMVLGEGEERAELMNLAEKLGVAENLQLPGFARNPYAIMAKAAVLALSSRWEGSPNVLVEAMACGTPVVATDCPSGAAETLADGRFGPLVPVGDDAALAKAIARTLDEPVSKEDLLRRAEDFSVGQATDTYLKVLLF